MFLCIREEHSCKTEMEAAALMMIGHVLQSSKQMIICDAGALRENATLVIAAKTISCYRSV